MVGGRSRRTWAASAASRLLRGFGVLAERALGEVTHNAFAAAPIGVVCSGLMVAANVGVTKTLVGSILIVSEMGGFHFLPTTLIAGVVAFMLTSEVRLIHAQRERSPRSPVDPTIGDEP